MGLPDLTAQVAFASLPTDAVQVWTTLPGDVEELAVKRGRADEKSETETGQMSWVLWNRQRQYDPTNASSPYHPNVLPVRQARMRATWAAVNYDLFVGDVEDWPQDWQGRVNKVDLTILDAFDSLSTADVSIDRTAELSGSRINAILDAAGWPSGARVVDAGQSLISAMTDATDGQFADVLGLLREASRSENGNIFIDGQGRFVFHNRHKRILPPYTTSQVRLSNRPVSPELPFSDAALKKQKKDIINHAVVTMPGGTAYTAQNLTSISAYRRRSHSVSVVLSSTAEAQSLSEHLVATYKDPTEAWDYVVLEPQLNDSLWAHALGREIGDRVTIEAFPPGGGSAIVIDGIIEKIEHKYVVGRWTTTWRLGRADTGEYWILGTSQLGVNNRLAY